MSRLPKPALDQTRTGRTLKASCGTRHDGSWINTDKVPKRGPVESQRIKVPSSYHRLLLEDTLLEDTWILVSNPLRSYT